MDASYLYNGRKQTQRKDLIKATNKTLWYGNESDGTCIVLFIPLHNNDGGSLLRLFRNPVVKSDKRHHITLVRKS